MPSQVSIVDLPGGPGDGADESKPRSSGGGGSSARKPASTAKRKATDTDLRTRLLNVIDRIIRAADARGDDELADTLKEDRDIIAQGIVSFTSGALAVFRIPILIVLAIVEPIMAFSRIGMLLFARLLGAREERAARRSGEPLE